MKQGNRLIRRALTPMFLLCAAAFVCRTATAGGGPENYFLVVNSASPASQTIANHYIDLRKIPSSNVLYLEWRGDLHTTDVETFRNQILGPALRAMEVRDISTHIDGVLYSSDFPYNIDFKTDVPEAERASLRQEFTPVGSLNSLTFYYQFVLARRPQFLNYQAATNLYFRPILNDKQIAPTHGFRGWYGWGKDGEPMEAGGNRYFLSAFLGLTTGRGNTTAEVVRYLRRSAAADGTAPAGTIYFSKFDDIRSKTRTDTPWSPWFKSALDALETIGVRAEVVNTIVPQSKKDVAGAMLGFANYDWSKSNSTILPGAIVENLTSYGAEMPKANQQTLLTEFLAAGAAGSSGTAVEPLNVPQKFPTAYLYVHYARGCNLVESYYQSVASPYQLVIVGDALCRPWAKVPQVTVAGAAAGDTLSGVVNITPSAEGGAAEVDRFELFVDGARVATCGSGGQLMLDTRGQSDGFHELRVVGIESGPIETQGRVILPVTFDNYGLKMRLTASAARARAREKIKLSAEAAGAAGILIYGNGRQWDVKGERGDITIDTDDLGTGPVVFRAMARGTKGKASHVFAAPVTVQIDPLR